MKRSEFLKRLGLGALVCAVAPKVLAKKPEPESMNVEVAGTIKGNDIYLGTKRYRCKDCMGGNTQNCTAMNCDIEREVQYEFIQSINRAMEEQIFRPID